MVVGVIRVSPYDDQAFYKNSSYSAYCFCSCTYFCSSSCCYSCYFFRLINHFGSSSWTTEWNSSRTRRIVLSTLSLVGISTCVEAKSLILSSMVYRRMLTAPTSFDTEEICLVKVFCTASIVLSIAYFSYVTVPSQLDYSSVPSCAGEIQNRYLSWSRREFFTIMT